MFNQRFKYVFSSVKHLSADIMSSDIVTTFISECEAVQSDRLWKAIRNTTNESSLVVADQVVDGCFTFLNHSYRLDTSCPSSWALDPYDDKLWQYHLHYQDYLIDLLRAYAFSGNKVYVNRIVELISDWICCNPFWVKDAWEPYTIAKRLDNWSQVVPPLATKGMFSHGFIQEIMKSVTLQAEFLMENLEYDVDNNHLIADAKALAVAGTVFASLPFSSRWREKGYTLLWAEMEKQVHSEGSHCEHSISYHMVVLKDYLETILIAKKHGVGVPANVLGKLEAMFSYLASMVLPTNETFLINDSVGGYPMNPKELLAVGTYLFRRSDWKSLCMDADLGYLAWICGSEGLAGFHRIEGEHPEGTDFAWAQSGYYIMRSGWSLQDTVVLFDCGPLGPKHSCGHSHADALSFCLYSGGAQRIVDSGVYEYKNGHWRSYFRSTAAHNTIVVDGENQSDVWHSFRVGRMARCTLIQWQLTDQMAVVEGCHDGYHTLGKRVMHRRRLEFRKPDEIEVMDRLDGRLKHSLDAFFHLMPSDLRKLSNNTCIAEFDDGLVLEFVFEAVAPFSVSVSETWVSREWKRKVLSPCITVSASAELPFELSTTIRVDAKGEL